MAGSPSGSCLVKLRIGLSDPSGNERRGHSDFARGLPVEVKRLTVRWGEIEFVVPLPRNRNST